MKAARARVLLTGASGGIGRASALTLARAGAALLLSGRSPARLAVQQRELCALVPGARVDWHAADLDDAAQIDALALAAARWNADVLVHAAGVPMFGGFETLTAAQLERSLRSNLLAPMMLVHALLPHLAAQPQASIVLVGSALGRIGLPGFAAYSAAKFGLRGFAEALRRELAGTGPAVQYLGPRTTLTAFNDERVHDYNRATGTAADPPERVAAALLKLLESGAAERFVGFPERLAVRLNGFAPALLDAAFARHRAQVRAPATDLAFKEHA